MEVHCIYCGCSYDVDDPEEELVPGADDDDAWDALAADHSEDCEWIATRAHRIEPEEEDDRDDRDDGDKIYLADDEWFSSREDADAAARSYVLDRATTQQRVSCVVAAYDRETGQCVESWRYRGSVDGSRSPMAIREVVTVTSTADLDANDLADALAEAMERAC